MSSVNNKRPVPPMPGPGGPGMRGGFGKPKDFKKSWGQILGYTKPYRTSLIIAIIFSFWIFSISDFLISLSA